MEVSPSSKCSQLSIFPISKELLEFTMQHHGVFTTFFGSQEKDNSRESRRVSISIDSRDSFAREGKKQLYFSSLKDKNHAKAEGGQTDEASGLAALCLSFLV